MKNNRGMSIVMVLVASVIVAMTSVFLTRMMSSGFKANRDIAMKLDYSAIKQLISRDMDCAQTLPAIPASCNSGGYIILRDRMGNPLTTALITTGVLAGSGAVGQWRIRSKCDLVNNTLVIEAAMVNGDVFAKDPYYGVFDFANGVINPMFGPVGAGKAIPICRDRFAPATTTQCAAGEYAWKVDFNSKTLYCTPLPAAPVPPPPAPLPSCAANEVLTTNAAGIPFCRRPFPNCANNEVLSTDAASNPVCKPQRVFGGGFFRWARGNTGSVGLPDTTWCAVPNPRTGDCTCPSWAPIEIEVFNFVNAPVSGPGGCPFYDHWYPSPPPAVCAAKAVVCSES
jgi:type II secretory pathway pseudopilin PulG